MGNEYNLNSQGIMERECTKYGIFSDEAREVVVLMVPNIYVYILMII